MFAGFALTLLSFAVFSYSQIDLNLTLSSFPIYQVLQNQLIQLGYFNRKLSAAIYILFLILLFGFYIFFIKLVREKKLSQTHIRKLVIIAAVILLFSYPAFSHDIFNYIFDTRILITHKSNPYQFTALDFPQDLWTRFMRWTHRTYPYGPLWIPITIPFYLLGFGKFTLTLFWYKFLAALSFIFSTELLKRILKIANPKYANLGVVIFALNPLILIEGLVSAHIDITMTALFLAAVYFAVCKKRKALSLFTLLASGAVKFISAAALPAWFFWNSEKDGYQKGAMAALISISLATITLIWVKEILPWYWVLPLSASALLPHKRWLVVINIGLSLGLLLRYAPYLVVGDYTQSVKNAREFLTLIPILAAAFVIWVKKRKYLPQL